MSETTSNEPGIEMDDTDVTSIVVIGLVSTVLVLCSALGVTALYDHWTSQLSNKRVVQAEYTEAKLELDKQETMLHPTIPVVDPATGAHTIPIDHAKILVVKEMSEAQKTE